MKPNQIVSIQNSLKTISRSYRTLLPGFSVNRNQSRILTAYLNARLENHYRIPKGEQSTHVRHVSANKNIRAAEMAVSDFRVKYSARVFEDPQDGHALNDANTKRKLDVTIYHWSA